jgi:hypothetical protein
MGFVALQSVMSAAVPGLLVARSRHELAVSRRLHGLSATPAPDSNIRTGSSSPELHVPFRVHSCCHLPDTRKHRAPPLGSRSPSRHKHTESTNCRGFHTSTIGPPSAFLALSTGYSSAHLVGLFHPTATSGIHSSGAFPAAKPPCLIDKPSSHAAGDSCLPVSCPTGASKGHLDYRVLFRAAIRCCRQVG